MGILGVEGGWERWVYYLLYLYSHLLFGYIQWSCDCTKKIPATINMYLVLPWFYIYFAILFKHRRLNIKQSLISCLCSIHYFSFHFTFGWWFQGLKKKILHFTNRRSKEDWLHLNNHNENHNITFLSIHTWLTIELRRNPWCAEWPSQRSSAKVLNGH